MPPKRKKTADQQETNGKRARQTTLPGAISESKFGSNWTVTNSLVILNCPESKPSSKILSLDMDGTIITTASGNVFAKDVNDWKLLNDQVTKILKEYAANGFKIVIMSNQSGVTKGYLSVANLQKKVENIVTKIGVPIQCYFSILADHCRKPLTGMWDELERSGNGGVKVDRAASFYCGDAAGRPAMGQRKKDHSCCDRLFAMNLGVPFLTPEQLWFKQTDPGPFSLPSFDPRLFLDDSYVKHGAMPKLTAPGKPEMIVMVGYPGSGKSYFCQTILEPLGYTVANRDTLGTWQKCVKLCEDTLTQGRSVAVDNTNMDLESRSRYIKVAKDSKVPVRCFVMQTDVEHCRHNERYRTLTDSKHIVVSQMVFNMLKSKYVHPTTKEGFSEVLDIPFTFDPNIKQRDLYCQFLLEK